MIDVTTTAALRPKILDMTFSSFFKNMEWDGKFRLIIDVAPVPEFKKGKVSQERVLEVARRYFDNIIPRTLDESKYSEAMKWAWKTSESDFVLQWEDDWKLVKKVYLQEIIDFMSSDDSIGMVYFDRSGKSVFSHKPYKDSFERINLSFWERTKGKSIGGPPALLKQSYIQDILKIMDDTICPDVISREPEIRKEINKWRIFVYTGHSIGNIVVDIGKSWKIKNKIKMKKNTPRGLTWEKQKT